MRCTSAQLIRLISSSAWWCWTVESMCCARSHWRWTNVSRGVYWSMPRRAGCCASRRFGHASFPPTIIWKRAWTTMIWVQSKRWKSNSGSICESLTDWSKNSRFSPFFFSLKFQSWTSDKRDNKIPAKRNSAAEPSWIWASTQFSSLNLFSAPNRCQSQQKAN